VEGKKQMMVMQIEMSKKSSALIYPLTTERLSAEEVMQLRGTVSEHINRGTRQIVLDMNSVEHIDSLFVGALIYTLRRLSEVGGTLSLHNTSRYISRTLGHLKLWMLHDGFEVVEREEATE